MTQNERTGAIVIGFIAGAAVLSSLETAVGLVVWLATLLETHLAVVAFTVALTASTMMSVNSDVEYATWRDGKDFPGLVRRTITCFVSGVVCTIAASAILFGAPELNKFSSSLLIIAGAVAVVSALWAVWIGYQLYGDWRYLSEQTMRRA